MSANDIFMGNSVPAAKFEHPGDSVRGYVVREPVKSQQRKYNPDGIGELDFWEKSQAPKMQAVIDLDTGARDPLVEGDDGVRRVYVKDHGAPYAKGSGRIRDAFRDAVLAAGAKGVEVGGYLEVTYTGPGVGRGAIPPKLFMVTYRPPQPGQPQEMQVQQPYQPGQQPVQQQPQGPFQGQQQWVQPTTQATSQWTQPAQYNQQPVAAQHQGTPANSILSAMQQQGQQPQNDEPPF